jgi:anthranilate synthase/aminodeoxychorismate synthase-like glutamine amidotransferase
MVLVIDNFDSFTYNLVQYLGTLGVRVHVRRNNEVTPADVAALAPSHLVMSPGPGRPEEAGAMLDILKSVSPQTPVLGVCLGHQAIGLAFGGRVVRAPKPIHGKTSVIDHDGQSIFRGWPADAEVGRYHSLIVEAESMPEVLAITARTRGDGLVMGVRHRTRPIFGVQFHPESVLTPDGRQLLQNFLEVSA